MPARVAAAMGYRGGPWLARHRNQLLLTLRMLVSALLTYGLATLFHLPQAFWAVLTSVFVTQNSVGGSLKAAMDRLIGSACGALAGALPAIVVPSHQPLVIGIALLAGMTPVALLAAWYPNYRIAPITAVIVLLGAGAAFPVAYATERVLEIMFGSIVAIAVSAIVAPARAYHQVREAASETAALLAATMTVLTPFGPPRTEELATLAGRVRGTFNRLQVAAEEASRERRSHLSDHPDPEPLFRTLRRLQQDVLALGRLFAEPWPSTVEPVLGGSWTAYAATISAFLYDLGSALSGRVPVPAPSRPHIATAAFVQAIETCRRERLTRDLPAEVAGRILGSAFRVEQFRGDLEDLAARVEEASGSRY
jgi:uncharacterized membrane protein YccC